MYLLINSDQTLNAIVENLDQICQTAECECIALPHQTREEILGSIPFEEAIWDSDLQTVVHDPDCVVGGKTWRKRKASERIEQFYPLSQQLNLLRAGNRSTIKTMSAFIDQCRQWSNDPSTDPEQIDRIVP